MQLGVPIDEIATRPRTPKIDQIRARPSQSGPVWTVKNGHVHWDCIPSDRLRRFASFMRACAGCWCDGEGEHAGRACVEAGAGSRGRLRSLVQSGAFNEDRNRTVPSRSGQNWAISNTVVHYRDDCSLIFFLLVVSSCQHSFRENQSMESGDSIGPRRLKDVCNLFANADFWRSAGVRMPLRVCSVSVVGALTYRCAEQLARRVF